MKKLLILTATFPFEGGEQFLETEITYWQNSLFDQVMIVPAFRTGDKRYVPEGIAVADDKVSSKLQLLFALFSAFFSFIFVQELIYIYRYSRKNFLRKAFVAYKSLAWTFLYKREISLHIKEGEDIYVYSYWNDCQAYAAALLKKKGDINKVFSRAHAYDIYQESRFAEYMPLKRQFISYFDQVFVLSSKGSDYYIKTYSALPSQLSVARLGVEVDEHLKSYMPSPHQLRVLSISYCIPWKRLDKLLSVLSQFAQMNTEIQLIWTHIGDGPLRDKLERQAKEIVGKRENFQVHFLGHLPNTEVKSILHNRDFDVLVNCSTTEGIPVSIMEAMREGIPAIAPNIGGIMDLLGHGSGFLLSEYATEQEILEALNQIYSSLGDKELRMKAHQKIYVDFNADKNYRSFVKKIESLV